MSFERQRNVGGWVIGTPIEPSELESIDTNLSNALDGLAGGAYTTTAAVTVGGKGIQDAYSDTVAVVGNGSGQGTVSNIQAHRLRITGGATCPSALTVQLAADADGVSREITIDKLVPGCNVYSRDENNAVISAGSWLNRDTQYLTLMKFERLDGTWYCSHRSSDSVGLFETSDRVALQGPTRNELDAQESWWSADGDAPLIGNYWFYLPFGENGTRRRVHFPHLKNPTVLLFLFGSSTTVAVYSVVGAGERNVTFDFEYVTGAWRLVQVHRNDRPMGRNTMVLTSIIDDYIAVDTDRVDCVQCPNVDHLSTTGVKFTVKDPLFEGQELKIFFSSFIGKNYDPIIEVRPVDLSRLIVGWRFNQRIMASELDGSDRVWGGYPATLRMRVVNGAWQYESFGF